MAKTKSSSAQKGVMIPTDTYKALMEFMGEIEKRKAAEAESAERMAKAEAASQYRADIIGRMTNADMRAIERRLAEVLQSCSAIHQIANDLVCGVAGDEPEPYLLAIEEMARSNVKGLDACIEKIAGGPHSGQFAEELEAVEGAG
jgi:hypothetical protein